MNGYGCGPCRLPALSLILSRGLLREKGEGKGGKHDWRGALGTEKGKAREGEGKQQNKGREKAEKQ